MRPHIHIYIICVALLATLLQQPGAAMAQQFSIKGGPSYGSVTVPPRDAADRSDRMLNYFWELNYAYRFGTCKFVTVGLSYLGAGCTFHYTYQPSGFVAPYDVKTRFNNILVPVKFKVSTEHRAHPRIYGYIGMAPGCMFDEAREMLLEYVNPDPLPDDWEEKKAEYQDSNMQLFKKRNNIPTWTPKKFQNYLLMGGGMYYKHVLLDFAFYVSTFKDYEEFLAPVSFNHGIILCLGYQVSRDTKKRW